MQKARVTISVDPEVLAAAERGVSDGEARSVSAWVEDAMREKANNGTLADFLAEAFAETGGPPTDAEMAWADRVFDQ